jgi:hypothetical protein
LYHGPVGTQGEVFQAAVDYSNDAVMPLLKSTNRVPRQKNILMIGGRSGGMLMPFVELGNKCMVVDFNEDAITYARTLGISGVAGDYKKIKFDRKFDLVILDNVLEHFLSLTDEVPSLSELLNENGQIFVAVPDAEIFDTIFNFSDARKEFTLCHSFVFSRQSVIDHMQALGFFALAFDHRPHPQSLVILFEKRNEPLRSFSRQVYDRQKSAIARAEVKYWLYKISLLPWLWQNVVPVLKRSRGLTAFYRSVRSRIVGR